MTEHAHPQLESLWTFARRMLRWPLSLVTNGPRWTFRHLTITGRLK